MELSHLWIYGPIMPYGYETHKHHCLHAGFVPPYYIHRLFTANSSLQNFIQAHNTHHAQKLVECSSKFMQALQEKLIHFTTTIIVHQYTLIEQYINIRASYTLYFKPPQSNQHNYLRDYLLLYFKRIQPLISENMCNKYT